MAITLEQIEEMLYKDLFKGMESESILQLITLRLLF